MKEITIDKVLSVINSTIKVGEISPEQLTDNLSDFGMDSIMFIQIIVSLEEAFDCEIPDSKLFVSEMNTVEKIISILQSLDVGNSI